MVIAIVNASEKCPNDFVDFAAAACNDQLREACTLLGIVDVPAVIPYKLGAPFPPGDTRIMAVVDDMDVAGALGYHEDAAGVVFGRALWQDADSTSVTLSHECLEETMDPTCDAWFRDIVGRRWVAQEISDPVERDSYAQTVTVAGETRNVMVSNFVLPAWWRAATGSYDKMGKLSAPFTMSPGGYMVVCSIGANDEHSIFARRPEFGNGRSIVGTPPAAKFKQGSRTLARLERH